MPSSEIDEYVPGLIRGRIVLCRRRAFGYDGAAGFEDTYDIVDQLPGRYGQMRRLGRHVDGAGDCGGNDCFAKSS